jgi:hypothetical protein
MAGLQTIGPALPKRLPQGRLGGLRRPPPPSFRTGDLTPLRVAPTARTWRTGAVPSTARRILIITCLVAAALPALASAASADRLARQDAAGGVGSAVVWVDGAGASVVLP